MLKSKASHQLHVSSQHLNTYPFTCPACNLGFFKQDRYENHIRKSKQYGECPQRNNPAGCGTIEKKHACKVEGCGKRFFRRPRLDRHMTVAHPEYRPELPAVLADIGMGLPKKILKKINERKLSMNCKKKIDLFSSMFLGIGYYLCGEECAGYMYVCTSTHVPSPSCCV